MRKITNIMKNLYLNVEISDLKPKMLI